MQAIHANRSKDLTSGFGQTLRPDSTHVPCSHWKVCCNLHFVHLLSQNTHSDILNLKYVNRKKLEQSGRL